MWFGRWSPIYGWLANFYVRNDAGNTLAVAKVNDGFDDGDGGDGKGEDLPSTLPPPTATDRSVDCSLGNAADWPSGWESINSAKKSGRGLTHNMGEFGLT